MNATLEKKALDLLGLPTTSRAFLAEKLLASQNRPHLVIEFEESSQKRFGRSCAEIAKFLQARGYSLSRITDKDIVPYQPKEPEDYTFNVLATPDRNA